jgi:hypothetical protein
MKKNGRNNRGHTHTSHPNILIPPVHKYDNAEKKLATGTETET